jgi:asparagine synthase (glutamine-hydrolysing)
VCDGSSFSLLPETVLHTEEPTAYAIEVLSLLLSRASARHVKVVVTGEGSDEVFGGYRHFRANRWTSQLARLPLVLRRAIVLGSMLEATHPWIVPLILAPRGMGPERYRRLVGLIPAAEAGRALSRDLRHHLESLPPDDDWPLTLEQIGSLGSFAALRQCEMQIRLPDFILHTNDRSSMARSLEVRAPFLDHELVELCAGIPPSLMLRRGTEKYILRRALQPVLPAEICSRRKRGMFAPFVGWWRAPLPGFAEEMLSEYRLREAGYFDPGTVRDMLARHRARRADLSRILNAVLGVQLWDEIFIRRMSLSDAV